MCTISICALGFSQMTSKNGHTILPEAGDWALQTNGNLVVDMAMNVTDIMNPGQTATHPGFVEGLENVIVLKYFNSDDFATRYKISLTSSSETSKMYGDDYSMWEDDEQDNALLYKMTDSWWSLKLGYGHEYRRGHNRLQGYYGWEAMIGLNTGSEDNPNRKYSYEFSHEDMYNSGAEIGEDGEDGSVEDVFFTALDSRKNGFGVNLGARTFVGVEYFAAPKISVGAEFGWGLAIEMNGRSSVTTTTFEDEEGTSEDEGLGNSGSNMNFDVDKFGGNLTIAFHF